MNARPPIARPDSPSGKRWRRFAAGATIIAAAGAAFYVGCLAPSVDLAEARYETLLEPHEAPVGRPTGDSVRVTYLGTSTLLFDDGTTRLMIDGFLSRPSVCDLLGRIETDTATVDAVLHKLGVDSVGSIAALFVAQTHYDHALDVAHVARRTGATLHGSPSTLYVGAGGGLDSTEMDTLRLGVPVPVGGFGVTALRSVHSPMHPLINDVGDTLAAPLPQPACFLDYKEGGSYDFLIRRGPLTVLVTPSAGGIDTVLTRALHGREVDALFLGVGTLGKQDSTYRQAYYDRTLGLLGPTRTRPGWVIPIHWDNITRPLSKPFRAQPRFLDGSAAWLEEVPAFVRLLNRRLKEHTPGSDTIQVRMLQGYGSLTFPAPSPEARR